MAVISDIAGTTLNSFSINDKVTLFYSDNEPDENLGNLGDFCFTNNGNLYAKKIFKGNHDDENDDENNELINIPKWMKITDKVLPSAKGSKELVFDDIDINDEAAYNTTKNITYDNTDNHLHDNVVIQNEITDNSSTILPNIGYLNKNFVHNKGNEIIQDEKTFEVLKSNQQIPSNSNDTTVGTTQWINGKITSSLNPIQEDISQCQEDISSLNTKIETKTLKFPNYTSGISLPNEGSVESDGWIHFKLTWDGSGAIINGITVCDVRFNSDGTNTEWNIYPVKSGDTYSIWGSGSVTFYPFL